MSAIYVLTSPLFDKATIIVSDGKQLVIEASRTSPDAIYIHGVTINGKKSNKLWVHHDEIAHGGHIQFELSNIPNKELGTASEYAPPH